MKTPSILGVYSSKENTERAVERLKEPGFCDRLQGFSIDPYTLNEDHWTEGYVTLSHFDPPRRARLSEGVFPTGHGPAPHADFK